MSRQPSIALISLQNSFIDFGVRYTAAACRRLGMRVEVLWILREPEEFMSNADREIVSSWIREGQFDMAGIGLMSLVFSRAAKLTRNIQKNAGVPVIWGGIQPILAPEKCLEWADYVCAGDSEESVPELLRRIAEGEPVGSIDNIWYHKDSQLIDTGQHVVSDMDSVAHPDYELDHHWIFENRAVTKLTVDRMRKTMPWGYGRHYVISSRGCPYHCTYCINSALQRLMGEKHFMRIRSVNNVMEEIDFVCETFPFLDVFAIMDDSFFFKPKGWIEEFCDRFKKTGKQFGCLMHPKTVSREQVSRLIDAGLIGIQMGLQSGSEFTSQQIFNRPEPVSEFVRATQVLDEFVDRIQARTYDVIVDNPFETEEDQAETIRILAACKKPFLLDLFSLTLYPGSELFERAKAEGKIDDPAMVQEDKNFLKIKPTMLNRLTWMTHTTPENVILFFLDNRKTWWGRTLFALYYHFWENGLRLLLRHTKRAVFSFLGRFISK
jgi:radical SAM superfamily enzyme YgiQ (UPF0313 family)